MLRTIDAMREAFDKFDLSGKTAFVTGGGSGLGYYMVRGLARSPCVSTWSHTHPVWDNIDFRATHAGPVDMPKSASDRLDTQITPEPALEKRSRRQFVPEYKLRIIAQADACKYGELGALLRREKLYSNQLSDWRREYAQNGVAGLRKALPALHPRRPRISAASSSLRRKTVG